MALPSTYLCSRASMRASRSVEKSELFATGAGCAATAGRCCAETTVVSSARRNAESLETVMVDAFYSVGADGQAPYFAISRRTVLMLRIVVEAVRVFSRIAPVNSDRPRPTVEIQYNSRPWTWSASLLVRSAFNLAAADRDGRSPRNPT